MVYIILIQLLFILYILLKIDLNFKKLKLIKFFLLKIFFNNNMRKSYILFIFEIIWAYKFILFIKYNNLKRLAINL